MMAWRLCDRDDLAILFIILSIYSLVSTLYCIIKFSCVTRRHHTAEYTRTINEVSVLVLNFKQRLKLS